MEKNDTEELLLEGSEIKMNENICSYEALRKFPSLCRAVQLFDENYEEYCYSNGVANVYDVKFLVESIQRKVEDNIPYKDQLKMSFIIGLIGNFFEYGSYDIDPLLWTFGSILKLHVKDQELVEACIYILDHAGYATYE